ncbi:MAG: hypothetical protein IPK25_08675 [Saprospiraceae bacterium]|nr:hypothetical protein [Saprospiraceae bacterium]
MRSEILSDLLAKISITDLWKKLVNNHLLEHILETSDASSASSQARIYLDEFMNQRNQVAHPSGGSFIWPSYDDVIKHIEYFKVLSPVYVIDKSFFNFISTPPFDPKFIFCS